MLPGPCSLISSYEDLLKLLHKLKLGATSLCCWVFLRAEDFMPHTLITLVPSHQAPPSRRIASTLPILRQRDCNTFGGNNVNALSSASIIEDVDKTPQDPPNCAIYPNLLEKGEDILCKH